MPRPKNKAELLDLSKKNFESLMRFIESMSQQEQNLEFPEGTMNRNIRDVLMHLHHWHLMMLVWYTIGMKGERPEMPAKGYTWKTIPELNKWIWEKYSDIKLEDEKRQRSENETTWFISHSRTRTGYAKARRLYTQRCE